MKIVRHPAQDWSNLHETFRQRVAGVWDLANDTTGTPLQNYTDAVRGVQGILKDAIRSGTPVRALGGSWSLSPIAATTGIILNTKPLNIVFTISAGSLEAGTTAGARRLCLAQCGTGVWELNDFLRPRGLSLPACGASNGQTIAGAIATGTHGAAVGFGGIQDGVVGLHIITGTGRTTYLERATCPVVSSAFAAKLGADLLRDDDAFNAALVSVGATGFVMGVMVEAVDDYLLEATMRRVPYDAAYRAAISGPDFSFPALPHPGEAPFHFQTAINPYDLKGGAYITTMYKRPLRAGYTPPKPSADGLGPADDAPCFIGKIGDAVPALVPTVVNRVLAASLKPYERVTGRLAEIFTNTTLRGKVASAAYGLRPADVGRVMELLLALNKEKGPFAGLFAFRYVRASSALLAFTRFSPVTCVLELDGVLSSHTRAFYDAVCAMLEREGIPFTYHWGKMNLLNAARVRRMYGASLDKFLAARARLVDADVLRITSNDALRAWGLDAAPVADYSGGRVA